MMLRGFPPLLLLYVTIYAVCHRSAVLDNELRRALAANAAIAKGLKIATSVRPSETPTYVAAPYMRLRQLLPDATYDQLLTRGLRRSFKRADFGGSPFGEPNSSKRCWALNREAANVV